MKHTVSEQALALVEQRVPGLGGKLTPQDAATATGVTVDEARDALARLMELYVTRVTHDDQGNLQFAFELPLRQRGTKTAKERWAAIKEKLWRGFKVFFKIWIGLMVIVYFAVMLVVLLLLIIAQSAASSDNDDNRSSSSSGGMVAGLFRVLFEGLAWSTWARATPAGYAFDDHGYRYRTVQAPRGAKDPKKKSFIIAIYDLALGPERAPSDPLENEREVAAFLRAERGVLTPAEIVALSGGTIADAEERMADYLVRFDGEPTITDEGAVVGEFDSFIGGTATKDADAKVINYWDEFEAPYQHSGNSSGRNGGIVAMVLFTAVMGGYLLAGGLAAFGHSFPFFRTGAAKFLLGYLPVAFSIIYLLTALLRWPGVKRRESERLQRNRKKKVMRAIFQGKLWNATADQVYFTLVSLGDKELNRDIVASILGMLVLELGGSVELGEHGEGIYSFARLQREFEAAESMRNSRRIG
ncbi:MAG: hypothetical protein IT211_04880 [Armatimonadetes bacterium]|nr:hypothetical protein [Armatimonadota bacterium]